MPDYDLAVVGGGPAGYVGAIRAAQLGKKVICIEKERAGGTCLNWGCIPTKSLLRNADLYRSIAHQASQFGIQCGEVSFDWPTIMGRSRKVADQNAAGIEFLFKKYGVEYLVGEANSVQPGRVTVAQGKKTDITAANILLSTGVVPRPLPTTPFDGKVILSSREALVIPERPRRIIIIGAGAIGVEFAYFFNSFGAETHLIEMLPRILPQEDAEISDLLAKSFKKQGIKVLTETKVAEVKTSAQDVQIRVEGRTNAQLEADVCLVAIGVQPRLPKECPVKLTERGYVQVNDRYETSQPGIYAAGDIIGPPWLAHVASFEATQAIEGLFHGASPKRVEVFPGCTYCSPQVASVGLTEKAALDKKLPIKVGRFPFQASGKARAMGETEGFVKLIFAEPHRELIGAHIIGAEATELIAELTLAITLEATQEEIEATIHAHPTLSEAVHEAAGQAFGEAIHI
ncbi:MAG TPA: dihydrolipoyl dehydrogenase [Verrucomicrobiae bacterium]|nr:dihydrolipoyl dehydrogenase [Verrucomicrobiae bacterium]